MDGKESLQPRAESAAVTSKQKEEGRQGSILIITAVEAEREAVLRGIGQDDRFKVMAGGVGPVAAAVSTTRALASASDYSLVISAGIGGGFAGQADIGSIVVASEIIAADLGAETAEGFSSLEHLGFGSSRLGTDQAASKRLEEALRAAGMPVRLAPVLTLATVTGTAEKAAELAGRVPGAAAEAMEGFGAAWAASVFQLPVMEIRAISNAVGPRDRAAWRIQDAFQSLESACAVLREVM
ncbi:futalosine hydrolase [Paenibacillus sambharensis]|uniref:Futalosine hydrolase n=1 Tax=Paenibacillus sambharensis TaxID=1803190 RepID=A0A2W1LIM4_9BACL|nr:futalosine hydrolase [Paenibacillus sambharensis]PZD94912.1 futalosine hydrolase [Paenibacillus sambharensis]